MAVTNPDQWAIVKVVTIYQRDISEIVITEDTGWPVIWQTFDLHNDGYRRIAGHKAASHSEALVAAMASFPTP